MFFVETLCYHGDTADLEITNRADRLHVAGLGLPESSIEAPQDQKDAERQTLINRLVAEHGIHDYILRYYTPMAVTYARFLQPLVTVYDCMDELASFTGASS